MASVEIRDVRKAFGNLEVIQGVNVEIQDGELVILVGPSGCGKSTLLRMIAGLESIDRGALGALSVCQWEDGRPQFGPDRVHRICRRGCRSTPRQAC